MKFIQVAAGCLLLAFIVGCAGPGALPLRANSGNSANGASTHNSISYEVELRGLDGHGDLGMEELFESSLHLYTLKERQPATVASLRRRAEGDRETIKQILHSKGFYTGKSTVRIEQEGSSRAKVVVDIATGPAFRLRAFDIDLTTPLPDDESLPSAEQFDLRLGERADAAYIAAAEARTLEWLRNNGYPYARKISREVVVDEQAAVMDFAARFDPGPRSRFGEVAFSGHEGINEEYLRGYIPWTKGTLVNLAQLDALQQELSNTGLFSAVIVKLDERTKEIDPPDARQQATAAPIKVLLTAAPHRSIGGGVRYATDDGPGVRTFYEHRNFLGSNERLRLNLDLLLDLQTFDSSLRKPHFLRPDQDLVFSAIVQNEVDDAFERSGVEFAAGLERQLDARWRAGVSVGTDFSTIDDGTTDATSIIVGLPTFAAYDGTNNLLDPGSGSRLRFGVTPYVGRFDAQFVQFGLADIRASTYYAIDRQKKYIIAVRGRLASIFGAGLFDIPPPRRLYSGGGGSVRGYEKRFIGPIGADGDPTGGRSLVEAGIELRTRLTENIGLVPFFEAGSVSQEHYPDLEEGVQAAAGLGLRYFTAIGPLRLDVGVPLDRREEDDAFQVYVSIGQAF